MQRRLPNARILVDGEKVSSDEEAQDAVWFYDEFDWLGSVDIRQGAYYATTPKFLRVAGLHTAESDVLLRLIEAHGGNHRRYTWPIDMSGTLTEARTHYSPEDFRLLFLGEYLK